MYVHGDVRTGMPEPSKPYDCIAVNTFGMGALPGEFADARSDPKGKLLSALSHPDCVVIEDPNLQNTPDIIERYFKQSAVRRAARLSGRPRTGVPQHPMKSAKAVSVYQTEITARYRHAISCPNSFCERWARFWSNHFTVSGSGPMLRSMVGAYEREAIRPNVFGRFSDLLKAAVFHPSMLIYLNNVGSIGPNSRVGLRLGKSYNENLAREVLELHTLGIGGGYSIDDIVDFAKALTGRSVGLNRKQAKTLGRTCFKAGNHEPGAKTVLGKTFPDYGAGQAGAILDWLCVQPATATFIASKLARHFVSPRVPGTLVSKLAKTFSNTNGDLTALASALINADESWRESERIYKTPEEFVISTGRALTSGDVKPDIMIAKKLGQAPFMAPSPKGWAASGRDGINAENLLLRLSWLRVELEKSPGWINAPYLLQEALGGHGSGALRALVSGPLPRLDCLRAVLMSEEFLSR